MPKIHPTAGDLFQIQIKGSAYGLHQNITAVVTTVGPDLAELLVEGTPDLVGSVKIDDYTYDHKQNRWLLKPLVPAPSSRAGEVPAIICEDIPASAPLSPTKYPLTTGVKNWSDADA